jgi:putative transposase
VWHLTHRRRRREFLLKSGRDRNTYLRWLCEARKRLGFCVLDYMITSNHVHLLVQDTGENVIAWSMQLTAGRSAQAFNRRKTGWVPSGKTAITPPRLKRTRTCIAAWSTSI